MIIKFGEDVWVSPSSDKFGWTMIAPNTVKYHPGHTLGDARFTIIAEGSPRWLQLHHQPLWKSVSP